MKYEKYAILAILVILAVTLAACQQRDQMPDENGNELGSEDPTLDENIDEKGCDISLGQSWCPSLNECVRTWETLCPEYEEYYREPTACTMEYMPVTGEITIPTEQGELIIIKEFSNRCVAESAGARNIHALDGSGEESVTNFEECVALGNEIIQSFPEQCVHNEEVFTREITPEELSELEFSEICRLQDGEYVAEHSECEYMTEEICSLLGGEFKECESACRHDPEYPEIMCHTACVQVCVFD